MSQSNLSYSEHLGELSRRKLLRVTGSSDTLRRAVLIHNIMRSTASLPSTPITPPPTPAEDYDFSYAQHRHHYEDPVVVPDHQASHSGAADSSGAQPEDFLLFPAMTSSPSHSAHHDAYLHSQEQNWLDSILDDLEDVSVSVVPADDDVSLPIDDEPTPCLPQSLFSSGTPPSSPPLRPAPISTSDYLIPASPTSPPPLDLDSDEGDFDDSDSDGEYEEVITPSSSTDLTPPDQYFLRNLPFRRYPLPPEHFKPLP